MTLINATFNARMIGTEELCKSFVKPSSFSEVASSNNTILIGPRGSGKTTLLRMLDVQSLDMWEHDDVKGITFSGVFIRTDKLWKTQYDTIKERLNNKDHNDMAMEGLNYLFSLHILECIINTISYRLKKSNKFQKVESNDNSQIELNLVSKLSELWEITPDIMTLNSLLVAIIIKKKYILSYIENQDMDKIERRKQEPVIFLIGQTVDLVNLYFDDKERRWALLFDELELAPECFMKLLVEAMRGENDKLIFKLALAPYTDYFIELSPANLVAVRNEDYKVIELARDEQEMKGFIMSLCESLFKKNELQNDVKDYFDEKEDIDYVAQAVKLKEMDTTFLDYLNKKSIDIDKSDPRFRKIQFICHLRYYNIYSKHKNPSDFYGGFDNICKSLEYNPRRIIGIMTRFIATLIAPKNKSNAEKNTISIPFQLSELSKYYEFIESYLRSECSEKQGESVFNILAEIAEFFKSEIYGEFNPAPAGSFNCKSILTIPRAIKVGINIGALIIINDTGDGFFKQNSRIRFSYIFSHKYDLLLTRQKEISLDTILSKSINKKDDNQLRLDV